MNRRKYSVTRSRAPRPDLLASFLGVLLLAASSAAHAEEGFPFGVAAGDVTGTTAILWTRVDGLSVVRYELADGETFAALEQSGLVLASAENDFVVKVELTDLSPATAYVYRFRVEGDPDRISPVGHFSTAPATDRAAALRFVFTGDTAFTFGPFPIVSQAAGEQADFLLWFGDTIYADDPAGTEGSATTLDAYRRKYQEIRSDPHFQEALAALPVWVGWDDHEVTDNYAGTDPEFSTEQLEAAYRAFFEYMPLTEQQAPDDAYRTYRRFKWGSQVEFFLLDGRQYRDPSAESTCESHPDPLGTIVGPLLADRTCATALSEPRTLLGEEQFEWLTAGLLESTAAVKFVVNDVPLSFIGLLPYDRWDGYDAERKALLEFIDANEINGVVFLTTDFHSNWYNPDLLRYFRCHRQDYELSGDVYVVETIVGPVGVPTLHESALELAGEIIGQPIGWLLRSILTGVEQHALCRLQRLSGFTLTETNRVSYAVIDVSPDGEVSISYRGVDPDDAQDPEVAVETFYTSPSGPPPSLPCCLPLVLLVLAGWPALAARRGRMAR